MAFLPTSSAAIWAANGVDLRDPLKPCAPAEDHAIVFPWASVIVIIVLLNVALICATPEVMFFFSLRLTRNFSLAILFSFVSNRTRHRLPVDAGSAASETYFFLPAIALAGPLRVRAF